MIEGLAHRLYSYKMRSSHEHFLWFRKVQLTFLAQSSPFPPPPVLWLLWCFLAPAKIKSRRAGHCKDGYFSRSIGPVESRMGKIGLVWFCKYQSILFPPQNQKQGYFGASDPYTGLLFGEGPGVQQSHICSLMSLYSIKGGWLNLFQTDLNNILARQDSSFLSSRGIEGSVGIWPIWKRPWKILSALIWRKAESWTWMCTSPHCK